MTADEEVFNDRFASASKAAVECHPLLQSEANRLLDRLKRELHDSHRTLAGEVYRSLTHGESSDELTAVESLRVYALSIDLCL